MAKFIIEYNINIGDEVEFRIGNSLKNGIVQDISQLPDVFIEGQENGEYKRWRVGIDNINMFEGTYFNSGISSNVIIEDNEPVEFIHCGDLGTPEFELTKFRLKGENEFH
ncbi:MAG: hypothetical protein IKO36_05605 [Bacteroidaceae bacterium]|nr:hypothetical protein [Bacteroidaceae bacterium]